MKKFLAAVLALLMLIPTLCFSEESANQIEADRSITITSEDLIAVIGKPLKLNAEVKRIKDEAPAKSTLVWDSSDEGIAKVNAQGSVTGIAPGNATITVSLKDNPDINASVTVNVIQPVKSIKVENQKMTLVIGGNLEAAQGKINVQIVPENATVQTCTYSTSDESIVTVDNEGNIKAVAAGKATVTIIPDDERTKAKAVCNITVGQAVTGITIPSSQVIQKNKTFALKPTISPDNAMSKSVEYSSSDDSVATVTKAGVIRGVKCGKATITCTATDGTGVSAACEVTIIQPVTKLSSKTNKITLMKGETHRWNVSVDPYDATNRTINYKSDASYIANVETNGLITGKSTGKTKITASSTDGSQKKTFCTVIVEPSVPITLDSIGHGIFNYNLLGITVTNRCSTLTIVDFDFDMKFYDYGGSVINGGSFSLGKQVRIGPGRQKTIKRTVYGSGQAYKTVITITGVLFSNGIYWSIPSSEQESWQFTRR